MLPDNLLKQLQAENELLQIQLQDLNEMISAREEELELLRKKATQAIELQSRLDMNLDGFYQMQQIIGEQQQNAEAASKREASLEKELIESIEMETRFYNLKDQLESTKAALTDVNKEVDKMASLYKEVAQLKSRITELESNAEIMTMENGFLKEELEKIRQETQAP